jgi:hypothetical protein
VKKTKVATKANVVRTSIKVLKNGQSWHGGNHKWSLPELIDNTWKPGAWTSAINPVWCESGWHLTNNPVMSVEMYLQCIARTDRIGQSSDRVTVVHIQSSEIERKMFGVLEKRVADHDMFVSLYEELRREGVAQA